MRLISLVKVCKKILGSYVTLIIKVFFERALLILVFSNFKMTYFHVRRLTIAVTYVGPFPAFLTSESLSWTRVDAYRTYHCFKTIIIFMFKCKVTFCTSTFIYSQLKIVDLS